MRDLTSDLTGPVTPQQAEQRDAAKQAVSRYQAAYPDPDARDLSELDERTLGARRDLLQQVVRTAVDRYRDELLDLTLRECGMDDLGPDGLSER